MTPLQRTFVEWFGIGYAPAALLEQLYLARGATVTYAHLRAALGIKAQAVTNRAFTLHQAMDPDSLRCASRTGYRLTAIGLADCERALIDQRRRRAA